MSAHPSPAPSGAPRTYTDARAQRIERLVNAYGVLTRRRLYVLCGASRWHSDESFRHVVDVAIRQGRIKALGDQLVESTRPWSAG